ncbi:MAG: TAT-variant-translocated molybdopterin oxidoreductase, partial [Verrucomicrobiota bacterium]
MNTSIPPGQIGPKYWRSLDELAGTPEFQQWVAREFPSGASEFLDPVSRRKFVKLMSASFLLAGLGATGCRRPVEKIYPFAKMPEDYVHGLPQYFATAMPSRRGAVPLVVKSSDGRPTKIEGNPDHPDSNGGADPFAQASVLSLYDPDRATRYARNGDLITRAAALDNLTALSATFGRGAGVSFLLEQSNSPSRARMVEAVRNKLPEARWHVFEPVDLDISRQAATLAYGKPVAPYYNLDKAQTILALDCDFIGSEQNATVNIARFAQGRGLAAKDDPMNRLYAVESLFTLTGMNADHRLRVAPSMMMAVLARFAFHIMDEPDDRTLAGLSEPAKTFDDWIVPCAKDLKASGGKSLVLAGYRLPVEAHLLVLAMNEMLGAVNQTLEFHNIPATTEDGISALVEDLNAGKVETLVILGGNPAYNAPADLDWARAQANAPNIIRLGYYEDETSWHPAPNVEQAKTPRRTKDHWDLPAAHFLESWGDARTANGTLVPIQPLIDPMFDGLTELEVLAILAGEEKTKPYEIARETFRIARQTFSAIGGGAENDWRKFLHDGCLSGSAPEPAGVQFKASLLPAVLAPLKVSPTPPGPDKLDVVFYRDSKMDDGRHNNNGWLQELPDPVTKLTWDNAILVSPKTARAMNLAPDDQKLDQTQRFYDQVVEIHLGARSVR